MKVQRSIRVSTALCLAALAAAVGGDALAAGCAAGAACAETPAFTATVTHLRESMQGTQRVLTATVRFENTSGKALTLGYVSESGIVLDEHGNRYVVPGTGSVRAIGVIDGANADPKFTLAPKQAADARFEFTLEPGKTAAGASYELELAIREIATSAGGTSKLGAEHALHFASLAPSSGKGAVASPAVAAAPVGAAAAAPTDPCGGSPRCYNAGNFIAEVMQVQPSAAGATRNHSVSFNIRFRNISDKPIILGYQSASSSSTDNFGSPYYWGRAGTHDTSVKGMGYVTGRSADPQFTLNPGQSRNATFGLIRYEAKPPYAQAWNYDVVIPEIEVLPGQQIRTVRQNSLNFANLAPGSFAGVAAGGTSQGDGTTPAGGTAEAADTASKVIDLLNKLKKN